MARQRLILNDTTARFLNKNTANATRLANGDWDFGESDYNDRAFAFQGEPSDSPTYQSPLTNPTARPTFPGVDRPTDGTQPGMPGPRDPNAPLVNNPVNRPTFPGVSNTPPPPGGPPSTTPTIPGNPSNPFQPTTTHQTKPLGVPKSGNSFDGGFSNLPNNNAGGNPLGRPAFAGSGDPVNMPAITNGVHTPGGNTNLANAAQVAANQNRAKSADGTTPPPGPTATQPQPGSNLLDPGEAERRWRTPVDRNGAGNSGQFDPNRWGSAGRPLWGSPTSPENVTDGSAANSYIYDDPRYFIRETSQGDSPTTTYRLRPDVAARFIRNANGEIDPNGSVWGQPAARGVYDWSRVTYDPEFGLLTPVENIIPSPDDFLDRWAPTIIQAVAFAAIGYGVGSAVGQLWNGVQAPGIDNTGTPLPNGTPPGGTGNPYFPSGPTNPMVPTPGPTTPPPNGNTPNSGPGPDGNPTPPPNDPSLGGPEVRDLGRIDVTAPRTPGNINNPLIPPPIIPPSGGSPSTPPPNNNPPPNNTTPNNTQPNRTNGNTFRNYVRNGLMTVNAYNLLARQFGWPTIGGGNTNTNGNTPGGGNNLGNLINDGIGINQDNRDRRWFDGRVDELLTRGDFYRDHRQAAINRYNNFLMNPDAALQDEGFKKVRERSLENLSRKYNARGMALSGNEMGALTEYGQELDWKQIQKEREELRSAMNLGNPSQMAIAGINAAGQSMRNRQNNSFNRGRFSNDLLNTRIGGKSVLEWAATIAERGWNAVSDAVRSWFQENDIDPFEIDGNYGEYDPNIEYDPGFNTGDPGYPTDEDGTDDTGAWWDGYI